MLDSEWEGTIEVVPVDTLDEVMEHALVRGELKKSLVQRLSEIIDRLTPEVTGELTPSTRLS